MVVEVMRVTRDRIAGVFCAAVVVAEFNDRCESP